MKLLLTDQDVAMVAKAFRVSLINSDDAIILPEAEFRSEALLTQDVFHRYRSETEMMRDVRMLSDKDIALDRAMIPLGLCTMKLNAALELAPVTWPE